ncbi:MAG: hypothetical protein ACOCUS_01150 [Polyangiales bacterium]
MPHFDKRTGDVVVRIVYDGIPEAGKTTNVNALCEIISLQRRGKRASPGTVGRPTAFFDWLDFTGGYLDGRRLRCQLLTVPGQPKLLRRRRYLLETADAVVFVADARRELVDDNRRFFEQLRGVLGRLEGSIPVGVILQANKQDFDDALDAKVLGAAMDVGRDVVAVGSEAHVGKGVTQTFMMAVRLAADRVRGLLVGGELEDEQEPASAEELHRQLVEMEQRAEAVADEAEGASSEQETSEGGEARETPAQSVAAPAGGPVGPAEEPPAVAPPAMNVPAGCSWPPVKGRAILASIDVSRATGPYRERLPWAASDCIELRAPGWALHTREQWVFDDAMEARARLRAVVRLCQRVPQPEGRTLLVAADGDRWRLWVVTPEHASLASELREAFDRADPESIGDRLLAWLDARETLAVAGEAGADPERLALESSRVVCLALPHELGGAPEEGARPEDGMAAFLSARIREDGDVRRLLGRAVAGRHRLRDALAGVLEGPD